MEINFVIGGAFKGILEMRPVTPAASSKHRSLHIVVAHRDEAVSQCEQGSPVGKYKGQRLQLQRCGGWKTNCKNRSPNGISLAFREISDVSITACFHLHVVRGTSPLVTLC